MPIENMPSLKNIANFDFSNESFVQNNEEANKLLNTKGKFTLDDKGNLTVTTAKKDNGFVRFFKGIFSSSYRAEQRALDRIPLLNKNASFLEKVTSDILSKYEDPGYNQTILTNGKKLAAQVMKNNLSDGNLIFNSYSLKQCIASSLKNLDRISSNSDYTITKDSANANINVAGKAMNAYQFVEQFSSHKQDLPTTEKLAGALVRHAISNPEAISAYISKEDAQALKLEMAKPKGSSGKILSLSTQLENAFLKDIGAKVQEGIEKGGSAEQLADLVLDILDSPTKLGDTAAFINKINDPDSGLISKMDTVDKTDPIAMDAGTRTRLDEIKDKLGGLDDKQAALVNRYLECNDIKLDKYVSIVNNCQDLKKVLFSNNDRLPILLLDIADASNRDLYEMAKAKDKDDNFGMDDLLVASSVIGFDSALRGQTISEEKANALQDLLCKLNEYNIKAGNNIRSNAEGALMQRTTSKIAAFLTEQLSFINGKGLSSDTERLDARDRHNLDIALKMSNISHSVPLHEALSTLNEKDKETAISFMTLNIYRQLEKTPDPLKADLTSLINDQIEKFNTDPNFKAICCASNIAEEDAKAIKDYLTTETGDGKSLSLVDNIKDNLKKPNAINTDGVHDVFTKDVKRGILTSINGEATQPNNYEDTLKKFKAIMPKEFYAPVSCMLDQGGIFFNITQSLMGINHLDSTFPNILPLLGEGFNTTMGRPVATIRQDGDKLIINADVKASIDHFPTQKALQSYNVSCEIAIDITKGINPDTKIPNSIEITKWERTPL